MSVKQTYLFTLTITPVQSFISQARKTKDLFAGSEILSKLIRETIEKLESYSDIEIIFPQNREFVSNKFVAKLGNKSQKDIEEIGEDLEKFIIDNFLIMNFQTLLEIKKNNINVKFLEEYFKPQVCGFFRVFWVAVKREDDYKKSYKKLEQNLGAVKNLRTFNQLEQKSGRKCSICGERNGLFYNSNKKSRYIIQDAIRIDNNQIKDNETLCAICFVKRFYKSINKNDKSSYPSLAKITLLDWLDKIDKSKIENYKVLFTNNEFDEELFFRENLTENYFKKNNISIEKILQSHEHLNNLDTSKQKKYYALIHFDIDDMGKTLSKLDKEEQKNLSKKLAEFSQRAKETVDRNGKTIYAGGDDFLGFVNLAYLFKVLDDIYCDFEAIIEDMTFSTSIVIAHYKAPLHKVLDFSRDLMKESKDYFSDKNALGVLVLSSNAIVSKTFCRYENLNLLKEMLDKEIGLNLYFKLDRIFNYLDNLTFDEYLLQKEMIKTEIYRLLKREDKSFNQNIYEELCRFLDTQYIELSTNSYKIDFDNFIGFLKTLEQIKKVR